jgi:hypothetical protein
MAEALDELADTLHPPVQADAGGDGVAVAEAPTEADGPAASDSSTSHGDDDPLGKLLAQWDEEQAGNGAAASGPGDDEIVRLLDEANQNAAREQEFAAAQQRYAGEAARAAITRSTTLAIQPAAGTGTSEVARAAPGRTAPAGDATAA